MSWLNNVHVFTFRVETINFKNKNTLIGVLNGPASCINYREYLLIAGEAKRSNFYWDSINI